MRTCRWVIPGSILRSGPTWRGGIWRGVASARKVPFSEVRRHDHADSCWMVIDDRVYDVTSYVDDHPGGESILEGAGKDASKEFAQVEHSDEARQKLQQFYIGDVDWSS